MRTRFVFVTAVGVAALGMFFSRCTRNSSSRQGGSPAEAPPERTIVVVSVKVEGGPTGLKLLDTSKMSIEGTWARVELGDFDAKSLSNFTPTVVCPGSELDGATGQYVVAQRESNTSSLYVVFEGKSISADNFKSTCKIVLR